MTIGRILASKTKPCVVYVSFPSSSKEYVYKCDFPVALNDTVIANHTRVVVHRIAQFDTLASKWVRPVPTEAEQERSIRICDIVQRLNQLLVQQKQQDEFAILARKNPEAKRLLAELKKLRK